MIYKYTLKKEDEFDVKVTDTENPNDSLSKKAIKLKFYIMNNLIGEASISAIDTNNGFLYDFEVKKKYRGKGYGTKILKYILKNYKVTDLTVTTDNDAAIHLYKKCGFKIKKKINDEINKTENYWMVR